MERILRDNDENLYQPKIHSDRIKELYIISQETHLPMTVIVDFALRSYFQTYMEEKQKREEAQMEAEWNAEERATDNNIDTDVFFGDYEPDDLYDL